MDGGRKRVIEQREKGKAKVEEDEVPETKKKKPRRSVEELAASSPEAEDEQLEDEPADYLSYLYISTFTECEETIQNLNAEADSINNRLATARDEGASEERISDMIRVADIFAKNANELQMRLRALRGLVGFGVDEIKLSKLNWASQNEVDDAISNTSKVLLSDMSTLISLQNKDMIFKDKIDPQVVEEIPDLEEKGTIVQLSHAIDTSSSAVPIKQIKSTRAYKEFKADLNYSSSLNKKIATDFELAAREKIRAKKAFMVRNMDELSRIKAIGMRIECLIIPAVPDCGFVLEEATKKYNVLLYRPPGVGEA